MIFPARRRSIALLAATLLGAVLLFQTLGPSTVGEVRAPTFTAFTLDSPPVTRTLEDYRGQPILLNVWATWCDPCREEMPSFERLYRDYRARGLRIVAVSIDNPGTTQLVRDFVKEYGLSFDILQDPGSAIMSAFGVLGLPETFVISRSGIIIARRYVADWDLPANRTLIDSLVAPTP